MTRPILLTGLAAFALHQLLQAAVVWLHAGAPYLFCQYDCNWYAGILAEGYMTAPDGDAGGSQPDQNVANWAFFPLFPLLARGLAALFGLAPPVAVILASKLLWLGAIWAFLIFQRRYLPAAPLWLGAAVLVLNPAAIYANAGYTEPLFLLLACLALAAMRAERPLTAGLLGALLTATRAAGLGLGLAFALHALGRVIRDPAADGGRLILAGLLIPLGFGGYMLFLYLHTGDAMAFSHIQRAWDRSLTNPLTHLMQGLAAPGYPRLMALSALGGLGLSVYLALRGEAGLALFLAFATLLPLATGTSSMGRYVAMQPGFLLALVMLMHRYRWMRLLLLPGAAGYLAMSHAWQEGAFYVI